MAKSLPEGVYHIVVMVYTVTKTGKVLTTQRSRNKTNSLNGKLQEVLLSAVKHLGQER